MKLNQVRYRKALIKEVQYGYGHNVKHAKPKQDEDCFHGLLGHTLLGNMWNFCCIAIRLCQVQDIFVFIA